jgi:hypothetical protein
VRREPFLGVMEATTAAAEAAEAFVGVAGAVISGDLARRTPEAAEAADAVSLPHGCRRRRRRRVTRRAIIASASASTLRNLLAGEASRNTVDDDAAAPAQLFISYRSPCFPTRLGDPIIIMSSTSLFSSRETTMVISLEEVGCPAALGAVVVPIMVGNSFSESENKRTPRVDKKFDATNEASLFPSLS